ncbi:MAG TPA: hypothetical protein VF977_11470 [Candidatus Binatia bacterium]
MKFIVLDDFPLWTTYLLGLLVLCGFLFAVTMLLRSLLIPSSNSPGSRTRGRRGRQPWVFVIAGALAVWFLGSSMYLRFHAVGIGPGEIELIFFWPRPPVSLGADALVDVKLLRAYRTCGHLEIATRQEIFRSVNFKKCEGAEEVLKNISPRIHANS